MVGTAEITAVEAQSGVGTIKMLAPVSYTAQSVAILLSLGSLGRYYVCVKACQAVRLSA